jgi:dTDP-4-dehydrorhamnose reductase
MEKAPIVITGAEGQLGAELCRQLGERAIGLSRNACDLLDAAAVSAAFDRLRPGVLINAAAYTAVDRAEVERAQCRAINADAVATLARTCNAFDCPLVQIGTDYVFGGDLLRDTPYGENDTPSPINVYGQTKLEGERAAATASRHLIVRTCGLYGPRHKPTQANFVDTMLRLSTERDSLRIVNDQHCTPSYTRHVARAIVALIDANASGIVHVVNRGATTWLDFASEIFRLAGRTIRIEPITTAEYNAPAARPRYSVLDTSRLESLEVALPHWHDALAEYLAHQS